WGAMKFEDWQVERRAVERAAAEREAERLVRKGQQAAKQRAEAERLAGVLREVAALLRDCAVPTEPLVEERWHLEWWPPAQWLLGFERATWDVVKSEGMRSVGWRFDGFAIDVEGRP